MFHSRTSLLYLIAHFVACILATSKLRKRPGKSEVDNASWDCFRGHKQKAVNSMLITGTITAKQKVRRKVPGLYAVCR